MAKQRSRRVTLPGADELFFRSSETTEPEPVPHTPHQEPPPEQAQANATVAAAPTDAAPTDAASPQATQSSSREAKPGAPQPSGRQRHDEKITVYVSAAELLALEQTRLTLRAEHGLTVDRGRVVREAVAVLLTDFAEHGDSSMLVRRLLEE